MQTGFWEGKASSPPPPGLTPSLCQEVCYIKIRGSHAGWATSPSCLASRGSCSILTDLPRKQLVPSGFPQFLFLAVPFCCFSGWVLLRHRHDPACVPLRSAAAFSCSTPNASCAIAGLFSSCSSSSPVRDVTLSYNERLRYEFLWMPHRTQVNGYWGFHVCLDRFLCGRGKQGQNDEGLWSRWKESLD